MKKQILVTLLIASSIAYAQKKPLSLQAQCIKKIVDIVDKDLSYAALPADIQELLDFEKNKRILKPHLEKRALELLKPAVPLFLQIPLRELDALTANVLKKDTNAND